MSCSSSDRQRPPTPPTVRHKPSHCRAGSVPTSSGNAMFWADGNVSTEDEEGHTRVRCQSGVEERLHHQSHSCSDELPSLVPLTAGEVEWQIDDDDDDIDRELWWLEMGRRGSHNTCCPHLARDEEDCVSLASLQRRSSHHGHMERRQEREEGGWTGLRRVLSSVSCLSVGLLHPPHCEKERPVQRILRPPRRRQTMRGLSGLPIEAANQWTTTTSTLDG
ncbi:hypothetical protein Pcinc_036347 [Petrolisthes cinctipes]|uniref:Uncharacterized protein n=1 Tax=Petrolisthes cinctipes TaxID=88211 RepID=A0AAE1EMN0_PETCI|nr:hypothetical protein Pcinc_036347 [Petrolisthes cinctipes]